MSTVRMTGGASEEEVAAVLFALTQARAATVAPQPRGPRRVPAPTYRSPLSWTAAAPVR